MDNCKLNLRPVGTGAGAPFQETTVSFQTLFFSTPGMTPEMTPGIQRHLAALTSTLRRSLPRLLTGLALTLGMVTAAHAATANDDIWQKVRFQLFGSTPVIEDTEGKVIALETPVRAMDAAIVPVAIRSRIEQTPERYIEKMWLIVDNNPSPVGAAFTLSPASGRADIETRIRIEEYTNVRVAARLNDGSVYVATNYVKASGGCSAPAGKDLAAAMANMGKMRLRLDGEPIAGKPILAQLMVSHPNTSGLAMDQVSRTYAAPHFVRHVEVSYRDQVVLEADIDFSISENPNFRFWFTPDGKGELVAKVVDTEDLTFSENLAISPAPSPQ